MIGTTTMPRSVIRNGYSLVPCSEPRYLTTRRRRVEIWSSTRWSSGDHAVGDVLLDAEAGQAAPSPRSPVITDGQAAVLEPAEQPAQLAADDRLVGQRAEQQLDGVEHDPLGADRRRSPWPSRMNSPSRSKSPVSTISAGSSRKASIGEQAVALELRRGRSRATRRWWPGRSAVSSKASSTPGSPKSRAPRTRNSIAEQRLAGAGGAAHQRGPPAGQTAAGDLVEAGDAGGRLLQARPSLVCVAVTGRPPRPVRSQGTPGQSSAPGLLGFRRRTDRRLGHCGQTRPPTRLLRLPSPCERRSGSSRASSGRQR